MSYRHCSCRHDDPYACATARLMSCASCPCDCHLHLGEFPPRDVPALSGLSPLFRPSQKQEVPTK